MSGPIDHTHKPISETQCGHGHNNCPSGITQNSRRLAIAAVLTGLFMGVEVIGGLFSGSLALLADAGHMLTDFAALTLAWVALLLSGRFAQLPTWAAFVNGLTLFGVAAWIVYEAFQRFSGPEDILAGPMLWVAIAGLFVNIIVFKILSGGSQDSLNMRGAAMHVLGDMLGSAAAIVAALVILTTAWTPVDPLLSIFVAIIILRSAALLVRDSGRILFNAD